MNLDALRTWGIAASGAFIAGALAVSFSAPPPASASRDELAPSSVALVARFRGSGPIARAQALAARDSARAARLIQAQLERQEEFAGLCFERFAPDGAELVLRSCEPLSVELHQRATARWLGQLRAMAAVEYAEESVPAGPVSAAQVGEP